MYAGGIRKVVNKTASYTVKVNQPDRSGTVFTNRGAAGAVTFTLPTPNAAMAGTFFEFCGEVDQNLIVAAPANKAVTLNALTGTSLAAQTANQKIGARIRATVNSDGTKWLLEGTTVGVTYTAA